MSKTKVDRAKPLDYDGVSAADHGLVTGYEGSPFFEAASLALLTGTLVYSEALRAFMRAAQQDPRYSSQIVHVVNFSLCRRPDWWGYRPGDTRAEALGSLASDLPAVANALPSMETTANASCGMALRNMSSREPWHPDFTLYLLRAYKLALSTGALHGLVLSRDIQILLALGPGIMEEIVDLKLVLDKHVRSYGDVRCLLLLMVRPDWRAYMDKRYLIPRPEAHYIISSLDAVPMEHERELFKMYMYSDTTKIPLVKALPYAIMASKGPFLPYLLREIAMRKAASAEYLDGLYDNLAYKDTLWQISPHPTRVNTRRNLASAILSLYGLESLQGRLSGLKARPCRIRFELFETLAELCKPLVLTMDFNESDVSWAVRMLGKRSNIVFSDEAMDNIKRGYASKYIKYANAGRSSTIADYDLDFPRPGEFMDWLSFYGDHSCDRAKDTSELYYALTERDLI